MISPGQKDVGKNPLYPFGQALSTFYNLSVIEERLVGCSIFRKPFLL
jgi:hypothetical protein